MDSERGKRAEESTEAASACEIPRDLLPEAISRTAPRDACRAAAVSKAFRDAADSDVVWSRFLPPDLPPLADGELHPAPRSKKDLFMRLSDGPVLLADGLVSMWLDRESGAKCYMLSARALSIVWGDTPQYWRWIPLTHSRFTEAAELLSVWWLEIHGQMHSKMLSNNTRYAAYMVFKIAGTSCGLNSPAQEASVSIGQRKSERLVCVDCSGQTVRRRGPPPPYAQPPAHAHLPQQRADNWMELEMGEFYNKEGDDGEVSISLTEIKELGWKRGLIVQGIEIRPKKKG